MTHIPKKIRKSLKSQILQTKKNDKSFGIKERLKKFSEMFKQVYRNAQKNHEKRIKSA